MLETTIRVTGMEYHEYVKRSIISEFISCCWDIVNKSHAQIIILKSLQCQDMIYVYIAICS